MENFSDNARLKKHRRMVSASLQSSVCGFASAIDAQRKK
jgi:hypothetical protein